MPYAAENKISMAPFEGGVEITDAQYQEALAGIMSGQIVTVANGFAVMDKPEPPAPEPEPEKTPEERLIEWRETKTMPRAEFVINCHRWGLLNDTDAELAAAGGWPESFSDYLQGLDLTDRILARADWAGNNTIRRRSPLLNQIAKVKKLKPEQVDLLFGWSDAE
jgi:hypothetical protein